MKRPWNGIFLTEQTDLLLLWHDNRPRSVSRVVYIPRVHSVKTKPYSITAIKYLPVPGMQAVLGHVLVPCTCWPSRPPDTDPSVDNKSFRLLNWFKIKHICDGNVSLNLEFILGIWQHFIRLSNVITFSLILFFYIQQ